MNNSNLSTGRCIQWMRFVRPLIDCCLLLLALFLFMHFDNVSRKNQMEKTISQRIAHALQAPSDQVAKQQKIVSIAQQFSSETDMWNTFSNWQQATQPTSGNCRIETRRDLDKAPYSLQCTGGSNTKNSQTEKNAKPHTLFESNVLVAPEKTSRPTNHEKNIREKSADTKRNTVSVSGWINMPTGRKHFDPVSKKWLP